MIWDPTFSEFSYGFRPGRSAHGAINHAKQYVEKGLKRVVSIDLSKFFDRVNHDRLMSRLATKVHDKRLLKLIRKFLTSGVMIDGLVQATDEGTPQGALCKALHKPPYAKNKTMQSKHRNGLKLMHFYPINFA